MKIITDGEEVDDDEDGNEDNEDNEEALNITVVACELNCELLTLFWSTSSSPPTPRSFAHCTVSGKTSQLINISG